MGRDVLGPSAVLERFVEVTSDSLSCEGFRFLDAALVDEVTDSAGKTLSDVAEVRGCRGRLILTPSSLSAISVSEALRLLVALGDVVVVMDLVAAEEEVLSVALEADFGFLAFGLESLV